MATTDIQSHIPFREVTDGNGRVYRLGETDRDIMRRPRWTMVLFPWLGMM
ncbi:MFS transporter, partial [Streptomyces sp900116325]